MNRKGFSPLITGLDGGTEGGVPQGSWVSIFGNPGSYKTLHSLAWALNGLRNGEKVVYVSTEQSFPNLKQQIQTLGWEYNAQEGRLTRQLLTREEYGNLDIVWIDLVSLRSIASLASKTIEGHLSLFDPTLITFSIILGLEAVGSVKRRSQEITPELVKYASVSDGYFQFNRRHLDVHRDVHVRIIIDSISAMFTTKWSVAGRILTNMKLRLGTPIYTFLLTSQVSKTTEEELGAQIGHIVDGRIRLWNEMTRSNVARVTGWIAKMRITNHSRVLHEVRIEGGNRKRIVWSPLT